MIASLPMYDRPALRAAHGRLWEALDLGLKRTEPDDLWGHWHDPDLLFSQTCGLPYRMGLHKHLTLVGAPVFDLPDCPPGTYNSVIICRKADPRDKVEDFAQSPVAFNQPHSQSGWGALYAYAAQRGITFDTLVETGAHAASAQAVWEGRADLAALDAMTYQLLCRDTPEMADLRVLDRTAPTPATPYVTAHPEEAPRLRAKLRAAFAALPEEDHHVLGISGMTAVSHEAYMALPLPPEP